MMLLLSLHIYLVRKHGVTPAPDDNGPSKKFFPDQVFKDTVAIFVCFVVLILVAALLDAPLEQLADPTDTSYTPRPDWYFLWLFQTLKFFEGPLEVVGSMVLPGLGVLALLLVPFIDRGQLRKVTRRTTAIGVACLAAAVWASLTMAAMKSAPGGAVSEQAAAVETWQQLSPEELSGVAYYRRESCSSCHGARAGKVGPDLAKTAPRKSAAWMIEHFKQPSAVKPGSRMPPIQLADAQLNALAAFLMKLTPANAGVLETAPEFAVEGALVYQKSNCGACHQVNGMGMRLGPELNGLAKRRTREWVEQHFAAPRKLSPGSIMPAYPFTAKELEVVTSYLLALPVR
jgi:cbb3-type cytochrome oxidase cytochrome c subunit